MINLIIFDFGGVLGCEADDWSNTFKKIPELTGLAPLELEEMFNEHWPKLKIGAEAMRIFWKDVANKSKNKVNPEKLREIYNKNVSADKRALDFTKSLAKRYRIIILMNESDDGGKAKIEKFKLNEVFDKVYSSAQMGFGKPSKEAFEFVLKDQKVKPRETLFIDNQENNYDVAKALGINSILFKNLDQLQKELSNLLAN